MLGLALAMIMRILLLLSLTWLMKLTQPLFTVLYQEISGRDIILILADFFSSLKARLKFIKLWQALKKNN